MSKISRKSELSPSATGSNIDLGKNDGVVDMGRKSEPSVTSGGLGVNTEIQNIGGVSVSGGVSVDISPIDLGVNYDVSENAISVASGVEIPGGLLGVSGGLTVDLDTGEITGGSLGGEVAGLGINVSSSKDGGLGVEFTVQIPFTPIEISLGFGFPPKGKEPAPTPKPNGIDDPVIFPPGSDKYCCMALDSQGYTISTFDSFPDNEHREWNRKIIGKANNFDQRYPGWVMEVTSIYYEKNKLTEAVQNYYKTTETYNVSSYNSSEYRYNGEYISTNGGVIVGKESAIYGYLASKMNSSHPTMWAYAWSHTREGKVRFSVADGICYPNNIPEPLYIPNSSPPPPPPFPNPPPRKQNKMDTCCRENLKFLRAIYTGLGIAKFPGQLPATIIQEVPKEGEQPAEPPQVPIKDFVDLLDWQFRRDDERWGQWVVQIDVKDADITKEGDQNKQIKFPNLAESIAEMEGQMLSLTANVDALVALQVKNLAESGMAIQEAIKGYLAAKAIIKYMAFKSSEIDVPVPMTFTAGAESISELLQESEGHIKGTDYSEKETLRDVYLDLLQAAAIIRAVHWQRINTKSDTKSQLLSILKGSVDLASTIANPKKSTNGQEDKFDPAQNFEDFIDNVENGFRNTTGVSDIQNTYGRTPDRRPRIREIGDNISQAGGGN